MTKKRIILLVVVLVCCVVLLNMKLAKIEYTAISKMGEHPTSSEQDSKAQGVYVCDAKQLVQFSEGNPDVSVLAAWIERRRSLVKVRSIIPILWREYEWTEKPGYLVMVRHDGGLEAYLRSKAFLITDGAKKELRTMGIGTGMMIMKLDYMIDPEQDRIVVREKSAASLQQ